MFVIENETKGRSVDVTDHSVPAAGSVVVVVTELVFWCTFTNTGLTTVPYRVCAP